VIVGRREHPGLDAALMFTLRFDMRAPEGAAPATDLYAAAIDMCAWAETRGAVIAVLSEHHGTHDGHLPAPHILAAAIAARTKQLAILLAAVPITSRRSPDVIPYEDEDDALRNGSDRRRRSRTPAGRRCALPQQRSWRTSRVPSTARFC